MAFCVVVPTVRQDRPGFQETMDKVRESFTMPTEFHILDGSDGKVKTLNRALDEILAPSAADVYVTLDDDIILHPGWQEKIVAGFETLPKAGILSLWLGDSNEVKEYVGENTLEPWEIKNSVRYRKCQPWRHIPGIMLCFRQEVAQNIGRQPETGLKYDVFEDAWRGRKAWKLGWESAYIEGPPPELVTYQDTSEYVQEKRQDMAKSREIMDDVMGRDGVADPLSWRLRRFVAKLLGRAKADPEAPNQIQGK